METKKPQTVLTAASAPADGSATTAALAAYRASDREKDRVRQLMKMIPPSGGIALDVGAREGFLSMRLVDRFDKVVALDLEEPQILHPRVECVRGDVTRLQYPDGAFDFVLCAEVLEHIPPDQLRRACAELARVTKGHLVIGVPYDQDIRNDRTTCLRCGGRNPPWGHVNSFDEEKLNMLFPAMRIDSTVYVGETKDRTNAVSAFLADIAGNPYGTYLQDEGCVHCGSKLVRPARRGLLRRLAGAMSVRLRAVQRRFAPARPNWIHIRYSKPA